MLVIKLNGKISADQNKGGCDLGQMTQISLKLLLHDQTKQSEEAVVLPSAQTTRMHLTVPDQ